MIERQNEPKEGRIKKQKMLFMVVCTFFEQALNKRNLKRTEHIKLWTPPSLALSFIYLNLTGTGIYLKTIKQSPLESQIIAEIYKKNFAYGAFDVAFGTK